MIRSCSAWIVATMSPIRPVRRAVTAAISAASLVSPVLLPAAAASSRSSTSSSTADDLAAPRAQVPAAAHALGRRGGGGVERLRRGRAPVHQQRLVLVLLVEQAQPPDVAPLPRLGVEPPERQAVLGGAQRGEPVGVHRGGGVALGQRLRRADGLVVQHRLEPARGVGAALVEPVVEHGDVAPLVAEAVDVAVTVVGGTVSAPSPVGRVPSGPSTGEALWDTVRFHPSSRGTMTAVDDACRGTTTYEPTSAGVFAPVAAGRFPSGPPPVSGPSVWAL